MKKIIGICTILFVGILLLISLNNCDSCTNHNDTISEHQAQPLNITIFIDLSDRIKHEGQPTQIEKDTAIIGRIAEYFYADAKACESGLQYSKDIIKVLFYPAPSDAEMVKCSENLVLDIQECKEGKERKDRIKTIKETFQNNLEKVYSLALQANSFPGCDIWGFFSYKKVDAQCIKKGYRNIMFILTDGYIYHESTKEVNGNKYTYIMPHVLDNPNAELKVDRNGLEDLEIVMLEIQPENPRHLVPMKNIITKWFVDMGVKPENVNIEETGLPAQTKDYIKKVFTD